MSLRNMLQKVFLLLALLPTQSHPKTPSATPRNEARLVKQRAYKALHDKRPRRVLHFYHKLENLDDQGELLADIYDQLRPGDFTHKDIQRLEQITIEYRTRTGGLPKILDYWKRRMPTLFAAAA